MSSVPTNSRHLSSDHTNDRPLSLYDNLTAILPAPCTSTPIKTNYPKNPNTIQNNGYGDISFTFEDMINNSIRHDANQNHEQPISQSKLLSSNCYYNNDDDLRKSQMESSQSLPFSQLSEVNRNGHQSIAAVKAALSDAKSKFFGLSGDTVDGINNNREPLLNDSKNSKKIIQIIPKAQPKYQNIPINSAIFRNSMSHPNNNNNNEDDDRLPQTFHNIESPRNPSPVSENNYRSQNDKSSSLSPERSALNKNHRHTKSIPNGMDFGAATQPSQKVYMTTTVPQNIKGNNIAGRHTPTRNSLRHSRMLVVNKTFQGNNVKPPNPLNLKYPILSKTLLILKVILGVLLSFLGIWILCWAPHTRLQDNPYWSGISLLFAGILGLIIIRCKRIKRQRFRENCFLFVKMDSYLLSLVASVLCLIAFICATIHLTKLIANDTKCKSANILVANAACICEFNVKSVNSTQPGPLLQGYDENSYSFHYKDLSCSEVENGWQFILMMSMILNLLGFTFTLLYLCLILCFRHNSTRLYKTVQTNAF